MGVEISNSTNCLYIYIYIYSDAVVYNEDSSFKNELYYCPIPRAYYLLMSIIFSITFNKYS